MRIREITELKVINERVLSYRIRFPAISVRREVVVAEFSTFYTRRQFCIQNSDVIANCHANDVFLRITCPCKVKPFIPNFYSTVGMFRGIQFFKLLSKTALEPRSRGGSNA